MKDRHPATLAPKRLSSERSDAYLDANILIALSVPEPLSSMAAAARSLGMAVALP